METQKEGPKKVKDGEDESQRSSSVSSASAESAISDFSFDENGSAEHEDELSEKGLLQPGTTASDSGCAPGASSGSLESPPAQVMERPPDSSGYRIPSYVFARNKSNTPNAEWSTASNESLFSIHTGNMSFTRDQFSYLTKSGELGAYGPGDLRKSGELPPLSPKDLRKSGEMPPTPPDLQKSGEQIIAAHFTTPPLPTPSMPVVQKVPSSPRFSEASAVDLATGTKKDESKRGAKPSIDDIPFSASNVSHHSDASGQSFAFPVLTEIDRQKSVNSGAGRVEQQKDPSTPKEKEEKPKTPKTPKTPKATAESAPPPSSSSSSSSWFSRLSCCSCWKS